LSLNSLFLPLLISQIALILRRLARMKVSVTPMNLVEGTSETRGYWTYYRPAHTQEKDGLVANIVSLVRQNKPPVKPKRTKRGRKPVHSWEKLVCICIIMVILGSTFRDMQNDVPTLNIPWNQNGTLSRAPNNP
jgi:hypothetical protein